MTADLMDLVNQLRSTLAMMEVVLGAIADAIVCVGSDGSVQWCNAAFDRLVNLPHILVINQPFNQLLPLTQMDQPVAAADYPHVRLLQGDYAVAEYEYGFQDALGNGRLILEISGNCTEINLDPVAGLPASRSTVLVIRDVTQTKQAEAALRRSEQKYRNIFENSHVGIGRTRLEDGLFLDLNQRYAEIMGFSSAGELIGKRFSSEFYANPGDRDRILIELEEFGEVHNFAEQLRRPDGSTAWGLLSLRRNTEEGCLDFVITDITQRKQAEEALQHRAKMDSLLSQIARQFVDQDADAAIAFALGAIADFVGAQRSVVFAYSRQRQQFYVIHEWSAVGVPLMSNQIAALTQAKFPWFYNQILTGQAVQIPCVADLPIEAAAEKTWFEQHSTQSILMVPMLHSGNVVGFLAVDVTDRARTWSSETINLLQRVGELTAIARARYKAEEKFIKAFRSSPSPIAITTLAERRFLDVNNSYLRLSGCSLTEIIDHTADELNLGTTPAIYDQAIQQALTVGSVQNQEVKFRTKSGDLRTVLLSIEPIELSGTACMLNIIHDITERKRLENELISLVSHELRTPMMSLLGALDLLGSGQLGQLTSQGQQVLQIATTNTERLTRLVNDILDLEQMRSGKLTMQKVQCNAATLLVQATEAMQAMADQSHITLITQPQNSEILADPDRILQTLTNLLSNAIKFSEAGSTIWLTAKLQREKHPDLLIAVRDQGRGIPRDKLHIIFDRFQQVDASDSRAKGGTGLGLAICRNIIEQHEGKIWVESIVGEGSTFYIKLPVVNNELE